MNKALHILTLSSLALLSSELYAERDAGLYVGLKTGVLEPDSDTVQDDIEDDNPIGLVAGYEFGGLAIQGEYYSAENEIAGRDAQIETDVYGLYGVYRSNGFVYFLGKAGLVRGDSEITGVASEDDTAFSYGAGIGINVGNTIGVEAEYLIFEVEDFDIDFFGITGYIKFN